MSFFVGVVGVLKGLREAGRKDACLFGLQQRGDQVVLRIRAAYLEEAPQIAIEREDGRDYSPVVVELFDRHDELPPGMKLVAVASRHAESLGDDSHRQRQRIIAYQIHSALARCPPNTNSVLSSRLDISEGHELQYDGGHHASRGLG